MIDVIFVDIDGVLTDGTVYVDSDSKESKRISFEDIGAVSELKRSGARGHIKTAEIIARELGSMIH